MSASQWGIRENRQSQNHQTRPFKYPILNWLFAAIAVISLLQGRER